MKKNLISIALTVAILVGGGGYGFLVRDELTQLRQKEKESKEEFSPQARVLDQMKNRDSASSSLDSFITRYLRNLGSDDFDAESNALIDQTEILKTLAILNVDELKQVVKAIQDSNLNGEIKFHTTLQLLHAIIDQSPLEAFDLLERHPEWAQSEFMIHWIQHSAVHNLAFREPSLAVRWLSEQKFDDPEKLQGLGTVILSVIAEQDTALALQLMDKINFVRPEAQLATIAGQIRDTSSAELFLNRLDEIQLSPEEHQQAIQYLLDGAHRFRENSLLEEFEFVVKYLEQGRLGSKEQLFQRMSYNKTKKATKHWLKYLQQHPSDTSVNTAGDLMRGWAMREPEKARTWLEKQPAGVLTEEMASNYAHIASYDDPVATAKWALSLQEATLQKRALKEAVSSWHKKDPDAAAAFAEEWNVEIDDEEDFDDLEKILLLSPMLEQLKE